MSDAMRRLSRRQLPEAESGFDKYSSLLHILQGEEEFILDKDGFIVGSNLEAVNVTGYEEYEIMGKHISMFYRQDECEKATADLEKACRLGTAIVTGMRVKKRGVNFWAKMKIKFIAPTQPESHHYRVILQEATHRYLSKERISNLRDEYFAIFTNP